MAVQSEFWTNYVINRLWKDNQFLKYAFNEDSFVIGGKDNGKVVHINNPGARPVIVKNRSSYPATAIQRTDNDITYVLDRYTSDPTHIEKADLMEVSYPKIESVFGDHAGQLVETIADDMILKWLGAIAAPNIIATTGGASSLNNVPGQTGTRKVLIAADLKSTQKRMNLDNVPKADRYVMLESNMLDELTESLNISQNRDFSEAYDAAKGIVGELYGFKVMERSNVAIASSADAIAALGAAVGATDNVVSFAWQKDSVTRALGERRFFENKNDALYYGDVYSALIRAGGRRRRTDNTGVVALIKKP